MSESIIEPLLWDQENNRRMAARYRLSFDFDGYSIIPHDGWKSEAREATDEERELWQALVGDPRGSPATGNEIRAVLQGLSGPFTVNPRDLAVLCQMGGFRPTTERGDLLYGHLGDIQSITGQWCPVYVSRRIPVGFYYPGWESEMQYIPPDGPERVLAPELPDVVRDKIRLGIRPFIIDAGGL